MSFFAITDVPVRLVNGRGPHEGRVEVYYQRRWGTICDDLWSKEDADIICRMLGYPASVKATIEASYGPGSGPIWLDNVRCRGHEKSIKECSHQGWGNSNCRHSEDAGVVCAPKPTVPPPPTTPGKVVAKKEFNARGTTLISSRFFPLGRRGEKLLYTGYPRDICISKREFNILASVITKKNK